MILILHILVAIVSIGYTAYTFFAPSRSKLRVSQVLVVGTLVSGTYLVWSTKAHLVSACLTGLLYLGVVSYFIAAASNKLAAELSSNK